MAYAQYNVPSCNGSNVLFLALPPHRSAVRWEGPESRGSDGSRFISELPSARLFSVRFVEVNLGFSVG